MGRRLPATMLALAVLFASGSARGSPFYPQTIADHLGIKCRFSATGNNQPPCTICHRDLNGGAGTVIRKFGQNLEGLFGLTSQNAQLLISVLDQAKAMNLDSDGDGDTDIDALLACRDPNQPAGANIPPLQYGCVMSNQPNRSATAAAGLIGALGILIALRRRRRGARR
jgi:hypothetical protein